MRSNRKFPSLLALAFIGLSLGSCSQKQSESAVASNIEFTVGNSIVVPTSLTNTDDYTVTCTDGVKGPRVRTRFTLKWDGMGDANNVLVPLVVVMEIPNDGRLSGNYKSSLGAVGAIESVSILFGEFTNDYIAPSPTPYASTTCYGDFGSLPEPKLELTGSNQLIVNATFTVMGVMRNLNDVNIEVPFLKETTARVTYTAGSIPID